VAKRKIKFKLGEITIKNVELEIEDDREVATAVFSELQNQLANAVQPGFNKALLAAGEQVIEATPANGTGTATSGAKPTKKRALGAKTPSEPGRAQPIDFRHDASKYGNPQQAWSVTDKCVWLLFVLEGVVDTKEVTGPQIAVTFNQQFRPAGKIHPPHVTRDLARAKVQNPSLVGEDKGVWYLTDEGKKHAQQLIHGVLNTSAS
jgi:hypothetical protein